MTPADSGLQIWSFYPLNGPPYVWHGEPEGLNRPFLSVDRRKGTIYECYRFVPLHGEPYLVRTDPTSAAMPCTLTDMTIRECLYWYVRRDGSRYGSSNLTPGFPFVVNGNVVTEKRWLLIWRGGARREATDDDPDRHFANWRTLGADLNIAQETGPVLP